MTARWDPGDFFLFFALTCFKVKCLSLYIFYAMWNSCSTECIYKLWASFREWHIYSILVHLLPPHLDFPFIISFRGQFNSNFKIVLDCPLNLAYPIKSHVVVSYLYLLFCFYVEHIDNRACKIVLPVFNNLYDIPASVRNGLAFFFIFIVTFSNFTALSWLPDLTNWICLL